MAWCRQATSHYLSQCWLRFMSPNGVTRPQWVKLDHRLTHLGQVTHICVHKLTNIDSDNGLSPGRCQAIIWYNVGILWIGPLATKFCEILIEFHTFSVKKMYLKIPSWKCQPFCLGLNVLRKWPGAELSTYQVITKNCWIKCQQNQKKYINLNLRISSVKKLIIPNTMQKMVHITL